MGFFINHCTLIITFLYTQAMGLFINHCTLIFLEVSFWVRCKHWSGGLQKKTAPLYCSLRHIDDSARRHPWLFFSPASSVVPSRLVGAEIGPVLRRMMSSLA